MDVFLRGAHFLHHLRETNTSGNRWCWLPCQGFRISARCRLCEAGKMVVFRWCIYDIFDANSKVVERYLIVLWPLVLVFCRIAVYWYSDWFFIGKERSKPRLGVCEVLLLLFFSCNFAVSWKLFHILLKSERERETLWDSHHFHIYFDPAAFAHMILVKRRIRMNRKGILSCPPWEKHQAPGPWRCTEPMFCRAEFFTTQTWSPYEKIEVTDWWHEMMRVVSSFFWKTSASCCVSEVGGA